MAQTDGHGGQQIESAQWANLVKYFIETTYIFGIQAKTLKKKLKNYILHVTSDT